MAKIYAPAEFTASMLSPSLYRELLNLPDKAIVLLEFHSPGPDSRQVDVAVLCEYGVDVIEVKNKYGGAVIAHPNGPWQIKYDDGRLEYIPMNTIGGRSENPYDQAQNTADDFAHWLKAESRFRGKVFPAVLVPEGRPDADLRRRGFVSAMNGAENLKRALRSLNSYRRESKHWDVAQYGRIPEVLRLSEVGVASVTGQLVDSDTSRGIPGARILVSGQELHLNLDGEFSFMVPVGTHSIEIEPPPPYAATKITEPFPQGPVVNLRIPLSASKMDDEEDLRLTVQAVVEDLTREREEREALFAIITEQAASSSAKRTEQDSSHSAALNQLEEQLAEIRSALDQLTSRKSTEVTREQLQQSLALVHILNRPSEPSLSQIDRAHSATANEPVRSIRDAAAAPIVARRRLKRVPLLILAIVAAAGLWWGLESDAPLAFQQPNRPVAGSGPIVHGESPELGGAALPGVAVSAQGAPFDAPQSPADPSFGGETTLPGQVVLRAGSPTHGLGVNALSEYECPVSHPIKGNVNFEGERIYHSPNQAFYARTAPEMCFSSARDAQLENFRASKR